MRYENFIMGFGLGLGKVSRITLRDVILIIRATGSLSECLLLFLFIAINSGYCRDHHCRHHQSRYLQIVDFKK